VCGIGVPKGKLAPGLLKHQFFLLAKLFIKSPKRASRRFEKRTARKGFSPSKLLMPCKKVEMGVVREGKAKAKAALRQPHIKVAIPFMVF